MNTNSSSTRRFTDYVLPSFVLGVLLIYTYAKFFEHPYTGFRLDSAGKVFLIFVEQETEPILQVGDQVIEIDSVRWEDYSEDLRLKIFENATPGKIIDLLVERENQTILIPWIVAGPNLGEIRDLLISEGWLGFFFWIAGTFALLTLRPRDTRWRLFIAFNYLTATFLVIGSGVSFYHIWESAILMRVLVWFCIPVYLHLHWLFPKPLSRLPKTILWLGYLGIGLLAIAQWFDALPNDLFFLGYFLAVLGNVILLIFHAVKQPETRRDLGVLLLILVIAFLPSVVIGIVGGFVTEELAPWQPWVGGSALLSLPLFPVAYVYAVHRRRLGNLELRVNNLLSSFTFITLIGTIALASMIILAGQFSLAGASVIFSGIGFLTASILVFLGFAPFQAFFERRILGVPLPSKRLLESFSTHITTSLSQSDLIRVLQEEVFPSLLIRQFAFLHYDQGSLNVLSTMGLHQEPLPGQQDVSYLMEQSGKYRSPDLTTGDPSFAWVRLILPLKLGNQLHGFWLLGRRDPDDFYSHQEILTLTSLANLTAIALSNILQTERLTSMYQANINRYEEERVSLARDLHDSILNELAALPIRSDAPVFSPSFQDAYDRISDHLREITHHLRPSMLSFGLKLALESYADNLRQRNLDSVEILTNIQADSECRYPLMIESNIYRIVQEACENSLRYAQAKTLSISGNLAENQIELQVADDGVGLDPNTSLNFNDLLTHRHFGLAGMHERASVIGAELHIVSKPNEGTKIHLTWQSKGTI
jgi:two-component sensor histidine kinase